ncbi:B12-binding domain-containing radical SAM protein [Thermodesulfobacteriota bacterium]
MRVLLISANREKIIMRTLPLGLASVAAAAKRAGHDVKMADLIEAQDPQAMLVEAIREFQPEIIGISIRNIDDQNMGKPVFFLDQVRGILSHIRSLTGVPIVLGGAGYSIFPESTLEYLGADMGIQGEGEIVFPALLKGIQLNQNISDLPGLYRKGSKTVANRMFEKDLDRMPFPDTSLLAVDATDDPSFLFPIQSRRGCPMNCSYCSTPTIEGRRIRKHSIHSIVQEMSKWFKAGVSNFHFVDNTFNFPPMYAKGICNEMIKAQLPVKWRCIIYPAKIDEMLVKSMAKAGCSEIAIGFESGSKSILQRMNKRFDCEDVRLLCKMFSDHGIRQMGFLLLGGPGETTETVIESLQFADSLPLDLLKITAGIRIYPYTQIAKSAISDRKLSPENTLLFPGFYLANGLEGWLPETLHNWCEKRPHWVS